MKDTIQTTLIMETQPELIQKTCRTLSSSLEDFLAKLSVLLENEEDLTKQEEHYFLRLQGFSETSNPSTFYSKTLKAYYLMRGGETLETIFRVCDELGYNVQWAIYNSKDYGVPQNRERIFIKGYSRRECGEEVLSVQRQNRTIPELSLKQVNNHKKTTQSNRVYDINGLSITLNAASNNGLYLLNGTNDGNIATIDCNYHKGISPSDVKRNSRKRTHVVENNIKSIRMLTPVECERLQGFPDQWTKYGKDNELISDTQRYKCCGNAVTTNVITAIVDEMFEGVKE